MLSIVVLDHDRPDLARACLESLCRSEMPAEWQVVLVDNGSEEALATHVQDFRSRIGRFTLLRNDSNLSFARANNEAARQCEGDRLLFLNNDVCLSREAIGALMAVLCRHPQAGVVGGKLIFPATGRVQHAGMAQMLWGFASNFGVGGKVDDPRLCVEREVFAVTGAMLCIERRLFEQVGAFDEAFWYGYEDVDLCLKTRANGRSVIYSPDAVAVHHESATLKDHRDSRTFGRNYEIFRQKWGPTLLTGEHAFISRLRQKGVRRVAVFGTGVAAEGLFQVLEANGISVVAFSCSAGRKHGNDLLGRPVVPLEQLDRVGFDRLLIGTQYYFEVEEMLQELLPAEAIVFPVVE
jgi:GT2 family glycosyltransferase